MTSRALEGRVALITGASRGLGQTIAETLAESGAALALCARSMGALTEFGDALRSRYGAQVFMSKADVSDQQSAFGFVAAAVEALGPIHVLVNNAAVMGSVGPIESIAPTEWTTVFGVNVVGPIQMTAAALPSMKEAGGGSIINISGGGTGGASVPTRLTAYTTSKAAVAALTETLARELRAHSIRVNALAPGPLGGPFTQPVIDAGPELAGAELYEATLKQRATADGLVQFANLLVYLSSDASAWLTGRLLSARWETPEGLEERRHVIQDSSLFTLRRIDGELYAEVTREPSGA